MAYPLPVLLAQVDNILSADNNELPELARLRQVKAAVEQYSTDRPDTLTADITGDGGRYYEIVANLPGWVEGLSRIVAIEYPAEAVSADQDPVYLEREDWRDDYYVGATRYLYLRAHAPAATDTMRVTYTAAYRWTANTGVTTSVSQTAHGFSEDDYIYKAASGIWFEADDASLATHQVAASPTTDAFVAEALEADVPGAHFFAVCHLAAAYCCEAIAVKYARTSDSTISADAVDHGGRSERFRQRARDLRKLYQEMANMQGDDAGPQAAGAFVDWDTTPGRRFRRYLTH